MRTTTDHDRMQRSRRLWLSCCAADIGWAGGNGGLTDYRGSAGIGSCRITLPQPTTRRRSLTCPSLSSMRECFGDARSGPPARRRTSALPRERSPQPDLFPRSDPPLPATRQRSRYARNSRTNTREDGWISVSGLPAAWRPRSPRSALTSRSRPRGASLLHRRLGHRGSASAPARWLPEAEAHVPQRLQGMRLARDSVRRWPESSAGDERGSR